MSLFEKIYLSTKEAAFETILDGYKKHGSYVISFLYFANVMTGRLLEEQKHGWQKDYKHALENADILFADGIALQLFYRRGAVGRRNKQTPHNLNGTDFNPWFLRKILDRFDYVHLGLYTLYDERIGKPASYLQEVDKAFLRQFRQGFDFMHQAPYLERMNDEFPVERYSQSVQQKDFQVCILLMSIGTPAQEIRIEKNRALIEKLGILVINAGGTIDYISGFEKRAPGWVVKARVLETPRRILQQPKKNFKKFSAMFGIVRYWIFSLKNFFKKIFRISLAKMQ